ncbi:MAG: ATP-dependent helicase [Candidatus Magasanikbacteria bacterium]|nr:ATP-dependent helicase [Candidatus Magasanikbacteria bacterium]
MTDFFSTLNPEQRQVVENGEGPCLVLSGAGTGKTRTIVYRVAHLLHQGVAPEEILLVTFTNKAAAEMQRRVQALTAAAAPLPWSGTFHHLGYRLLRAHGARRGLPPGWRVLDTDDAQVLWRRILKELRPAGQRRFPSAGGLAGAVSFSRNAARPLSEVMAERYPEWQEWSAIISAAAEQYERAKQAVAGLDFDDLLAQTLRLLQEDSELKQRYAAQWRYILVDEYQDTNYLQAALIREWGSVHGNVLVVGDDAQSIYSFRAADVGNIRSFSATFPGAKIFSLTRNYRSTAAILAVANAALAAEATAFPKELTAERAGAGARPEIIAAADPAAEAEAVAERISALLESGTAPSAIAVLFRAAFHSQRLEAALAFRGIPYEYRGGVRFFERAHIKDAISYLRLVQNSGDALAWRRVLPLEAGMGEAAAERLVAALSAAGPLSSPLPVDKLIEWGRGIFSAAQQAGWSNFLTLWGLLAAVSEPTPARLIQALVKSPYAEYLASEYADYRERLLDLRQLADYAQEFSDLAEFLGSAALQESFRRPGDPVRSRAAEIILSTIHQAKGLEWEAVFVIHLARGIFPSDRAVLEGDLAEERRLFYVAATRAQNQLALSYPRWSGGETSRYLGPSEFIVELPIGLCAGASPGDPAESGSDAPIYVAEDSDWPAPRARPARRSFLKGIADL